MHNVRGSVPALHSITCFFSLLVVVFLLFTVVISHTLYFTEKKEMC